MIIKTYHILIYDEFISVDKKINKKIKCITYSIKHITTTLINLGT